MRRTKEQLNAQPPKASEVARLTSALGRLLGVQVDYPRTRWQTLWLARTLERLSEGEADVLRNAQYVKRVAQEVRLSGEWGSLVSLRDALALVRVDLGDARTRVRALEGEKDKRVKAMQRRHDEEMRTLTHTHDEATQEAMTYVRLLEEEEASILEDLGVRSTQDDAPTQDPDPSGLPVADDPGAPPVVAG